MSEANSISFEVTAGTGNIGLGGTNRIRNLTFSGTFTGNISSSDAVFFGNLTLRAGMTIAHAAGINFTFSGTTGTQVINTAGIALRNQVTFNGTGTYQLASNTTFGSSPNNRNLLLTSGTLDLNNFTLSHFGDFLSNGTGTRAINGGTTGGVIDLTATGTRTLWDMGTLTGFTRIGNPTVRVASGGSGTTQTIFHGTVTGGSEARAMSFILGGAGTITFSSTNWVLDLDKIGTPTIPGLSGGLDIYGSYGTSNPFCPLAFKSTSATVRNLPISSTFNWSIEGAGGFFQLQADTTADSISVLNGSFTTNEYDVFLNSFQFNFPTTKSITITTGSTLYFQNSIQGDFQGGMTNTTLNAFGTLHFEPRPFMNLSVDGGTLSNVYVYLPFGVPFCEGLTIGGSATDTTTITNFTLLNDAAIDLAVSLFSGSTTNVTNFSSNSTNGRRIYFQGLDGFAGPQAIMSKASGTVLVSRLALNSINATGGATWYSPFNAPYNNEDNGNNTGWIFDTYPPVSSANSNFFLLF
jgi:hypothetical protein